MKKYAIVAMLAAAFSLWTIGAYAQYDDIYYNPDVDARAERYESRSKQQNYDDYDYNDDASYASEEYDDETYDYYYTSRIRRFHRPVHGFGYFDPFYTDMYYYDPFLMTPGATVLIYDSPFSFNSWNRWNRWNRMGFGMGMGMGMGFGNPWAFSRFNNPFWGGPTMMVNNFYGFNSFGRGYWNAWDTWGGGGVWGPYSYFGGGSGLYCPPSWGNGYNYNTPAAVANTYYGPRGSNGAATTAPRTNIPRTSRDRINPEVTPRSTDRTVDATVPNRTVDRDRYSRTRPEARPSDTDRRIQPSDRYTRPADRAPADRYTRDRVSPPSRGIDRSTAQPPRSRSYSPPSRSIERGSTPTRQAPSYTPPSRSIQRPSAPAPSRSIERAPAPSRSSGSSSGTRSAPRRGN